jgi:uncharacterized protein YktA (UPF0223 family)
VIKLSAREKKLVSVLAVVLGAVILYYGILSPLGSFLSSTGNTYEKNIAQLKELDDIYQQYREIRDKKSRYEQLLRDTRGVSSLVEDNAAKAGIMNNKIYNRDHQTNLQNNYRKITTDIKFEGVNIKSAMDFLYYMENSNVLLKISYVRISQAVKERNNYDITVNIDSFKNQ